MNDDHGPSWDDPVWRIAGDGAWARGLRQLQGWWRETKLGVPAGPVNRRSGSRLVVSMLPVDDKYRRANFLSAEAVDASERRLADGGGLIAEDRLRRNLLSSQPLCFNLFGHVQRRSDLVMPWLRSLGLDVRHVTRVDLEWAPPRSLHFGGGSAFDAFIEYERHDGALGFVGIECKYAEDLTRTDVNHVRDVYRAWTESSPRWQPGATERLDRKGLRQLWLNTLLAQSLADTDTYASGRAVVLTCAADVDARRAVQDVRAELVDAQDLTWHAYEEIVRSIDDPEWRSTFATRYLDFSPIAHLLDPADTRHADPIPTSGSNLGLALLVAERVLGEGSVLSQLAAAGDTPGGDAIWRRLDVAVDDLKRLRIDAGALLGLNPGD